MSINILQIISEAQYSITESSLTLPVLVYLAISYVDFCQFLSLQTEVV